jgi:arsenite methyltransferase
MGFVEVERHEERSVGIEDCAHYPLFTPELLDLMRHHIPPDRQSRVARSVIFVARKAGG